MPPIEDALARFLADCEPAWAAAPARVLPAGMRPYADAPSLPRAA